MPIYIYERTDGSRFEHQQSMNDEPLTTCPDTGMYVRRVVTGGTDTQIYGSGSDAQRKTAERRKKALEKNPYHTTLPEYDHSNPESMISRKRQENLERVQKKRKKIERAVTAARSRKTKLD